MQNLHQNMPDDSIHKNLFQNTTPSKENVSDAFRNKLHELEMKFKANPSKVEIAEELADFYLAAHQNEKAIDIYEKFRNQLSLDALFNLTLAYYNSKNLKKAEEITRFILKKKPDEYRAIFNLGSIKASMGEKEEAKKYWNEVINRYPKTEEAKKAKEFLAILK
jgi:tetratricopeptide (TPR) repeat protein